MPYLFLLFLSTPVLMHAFCLSVCLGVPRAHYTPLQRYMGYLCTRKAQYAPLRRNVAWVRMSVCHWIKIRKYYWLHFEKNSCQQMGMVFLLWQVGLIANVKLHFSCPVQLSVRLYVKLTFKWSNQSGMKSFLLQGIGWLLICCCNNIYQSHVPMQPRFGVWYCLL